MRTLARVVALGLVCALLTGCAGFTSAPVVPPVGILFTDTVAPLDLDLDKTQLGTKTGRASAFALLGLFSFGDASTAAAARAAGIQTLNHADYEQMNVLFLFSSYTTIVYGD